MHLEILKYDSGIIVVLKNKLKNRVLTDIKQLKKIEIYV